MKKEVIGRMNGSVTREGGPWGRKPRPRTILAALLVPCAMATWFTNAVGSDLFCEVCESADWPAYDPTAFDPSAYVREKTLDVLDTIRNKNISVDRCIASSIDICDDIVTHVVSGDFEILPPIEYSEATPRLPGVKDLEEVCGPLRYWYYYLSEKGMFEVYTTNYTYWDLSSYVNDGDSRITALRGDKRITLFNEDDPLNLAMPSRSDVESAPAGTGEVTVYRDCKYYLSIPYSFFSTIEGEFGVAEFIWIEDIEFLAFLIIDRVLNSSADFDFSMSIREACIYNDESEGDMQHSCVEIRAYI